MARNTSFMLTEEQFLDGTMTLIPDELKSLCDAIGEGLPKAIARQWPLRFMAGIKPGQDLTLVHWKFLHWVLTDETITPGIKHPLVKDAVAQCAEVLRERSLGQPPDGKAARDAARAAWDAAGMAYAAARAARAADAADAAKEAAIAVREAASAAGVAYAVREAAYTVREAAREAAIAACTAAYIKMADKIIEIIEAAPQVVNSGTRLSQKKEFTQ